MLAAVQPSPWLRPAKMHLINVHQHQMASRDDKPHTALRLNKRGSNRQRFQKKKRRTGTAGKYQNKHPKRKQNNRRGGTTEQSTKNSSYTRPICGQMHKATKPQTKQNQTPTQMRQGGKHEKTEQTKQNTNKTNNNQYLSTSGGCNRHTSSQSCAKLRTLVPECICSRRNQCLSLSR